MSVTILCQQCRYWRLRKDLTSKDKEMMPYSVDETCGSYDASFEQRSEEENLRLFGHRVGICCSPKLTFVERPQKGAASLVDGSEFFAALCTSEFFGCVLGEVAVQEIGMDLSIPIELGRGVNEENS